ncbi:alpha/beta hydrolase [Actibacterium pelagium]|uniref:Hydrolase n=1 Tax=Actibacterium pelagium TaxID=2029103 RepID=A0A917EGB6_9RHOB|nr:alpha/beta hydrolase [Actibacterium pelagium]GGE37634.1 hydrolase [Actibacterium pelagium]
MSFRLRLLNFWFRRSIKPHLRRVATPEKARAEFEWIAPRLFWLPSGTCHLPRKLGNLDSHWFRRGAAADGKIVLYLHGGAYMAGSGRTHARLTAALAGQAGIEVCSPNYRLLQEAPFPAAFDDALHAWDALLAKGYAPSDIVLAGDSAGGGLAFALLADLLKDGQRPAGLVAFSPWTDLGLTGASLSANKSADTLLPVERVEEARDFYLDGADPRDPRASPLYASFPDCPPVLIHVGSTEILQDDSYRIEAHLRESGVDVTLRTFDQCPHVWHFFDAWLPEAREAIADAGQFIQASLVKASR